MFTSSSDRPVESHVKVERRDPLKNLFPGPCRKQAPIHGFGNKIQDLRPVVADLEQTSAQLTQLYEFKPTENLGCRCEKFAGGRMLSKDSPLEFGEEMEGAKIICRMTGLAWKFWSPIMKSQWWDQVLESWRSRSCLQFLLWPILRCDIHSWKYLCYDRALSRL